MYVVKGIVVTYYVCGMSHWIPAFAGMSVNGERQRPYFTSSVSGNAACQPNQKARW